jgi:hypothetical protein
MHSQRALAGAAAGACLVAAVAAQPRQDEPPWQAFSAAGSTDRRTAEAALWASLEGVPVVGPLARSGLQLSLQSVVTTTWGGWRRDQGTHTFSPRLEGGRLHDEAGVAWTPAPEALVSDRGDRLPRVPRIARSGSAGCLSIPPPSC